MASCSLRRPSIQLRLSSVLAIFVLQLVFVNAGQNARMLGGRVNDLSPPPSPKPGRVRHMIPPEIPPITRRSPPSPPPSYL
ncbi:hypothetical protein POTOM_029956 [Populus tomentosa]|uniref:Uncharacterized protein n=1 Tax=Populus tomentosa TaxID=118781 RepID=A0A8X7ZB02_POPTO|nr:hypothetical protein POTOM_029956 [Populus tomentosa]